MPLTAKGEEIKAAMQKQYGARKGEQVFYAAKNAGAITGVDETMLPVSPLPQQHNGAPPSPEPWNGLPAQVTQAETLERVAKRSDW